MGIQNSIMLSVMDIPWSEEDLALLKIFVNSNHKLQTELVKYADHRLIQLLTEITSNLLEGNIEIDKATFKRLSSQKAVLRKIVNPQDKSWINKKRIFIKCSRVILPLISPIIFQIINSLV